MEIGFRYLNLIAGDPDWTPQGASWGHNVTIRDIGHKMWDTDHGGPSVTSVTPAPAPPPSSHVSSHLPPSADVWNANTLDSGY